MMLAIPDVLTGAALAQMTAALGEAGWGDGNATSGHQSALAKRNTQLAEDDPLARTLGGAVLDALARSAPFVAAALPLKVYPPLFNRYGPGDRFETHVDSAIRIRRGSDFRIRSDLSATLFLSDPDAYDGGELIVEEPGGATRATKLPAGHMLLYPATTLHRVAPVTRGVRIASFFWVQSMVRDGGERDLLHGLDQAIQEASGALGADARSVVALTGVYHNLLRRWADV